MRRIILLFSFLCLSVIISAQEKTISGVVKDGATGELLPGVNVTIKGTTIGAITGLDGTYTIKVNSNDADLVFSFVGFIDEEIRVGDQTAIDVNLEADILGLDEVVVVGYGVQKKSLVTGSIAKVETEDITKGVVLDAASSLQGMAAGVIVQAGSGQPGDEISLNIRGVSTSGNSQPLYIVDGVPVSSISFLNPHDIKSMEVLKDAAAASIYGARGGNGVVIITTSSGEKGMNVSYDGYYGVANPWKKAEVLSPYEFALISNEATRNDGNLNVPFPNASPDIKGTDWWDEIVNKNAPLTSHNVTITGGNEVSTFNSSLSYFSQEGTFAPGKSSFERYTGRLNSNHKYGILSVGNSLSFTSSTSYGFNPNDGFERGAMITAAMNYDPMASVYDTEGEYFHSDLRTNEYTNPVALLSLINNETKINRILGNVFADIEIIEGVNFRTSVSIDGNYISSNFFNPQFYFDAALSNPNPNVSNERENILQWQIENTLTYNRTFGEHTFTILAGQSALEQNYESVRGTANELQFNDNDYAYIDNSLNFSGTRAYGTFEPYRLASYFGRVRYNYKEKYMLSTVVRADGTTRFGSNNKFGIFPSVSAGWVLSRESFFPQNDILNKMKLRASWGQNGNDRIGNFKYTSLLETNYYTLGTEQSDLAGKSPEALSNEDLKWETIEQTDIGVDLGFFSNKLNVVFDYYIKTTRDILIVPAIPSHAGPEGPAVNGGTVENRGVELELRYKESIGGFNYNVGLTYAYNKNEMTQIDNADKAIIGADASYFMQNVTMAFEGEAINSFYGLQTNGVFQDQAQIDNYVQNGQLIQPDAQPGDLIYVDQPTVDTDEDGIPDAGDGKIDGDDRVVIGNPFPTNTLGLNISCDWKGIDLSVSLYAALGYQIFNAIRRPDYPYQNYQAKVFEDGGRWMGKGSTNENPRVTEKDPNNNYSRANSWMVEDADMLRLKKISLGYTLPSSITDGVNISRLRVYVAADNLLTLTKYSGLDPEIGSSSDTGDTEPGLTMDRGIDHGVYPQSRSFLVGVNVTF